MQRSPPVKRRNPKARALACPSLRPKRVESRKVWRKSDRVKAKARLRKDLLCDHEAAELVRAAA